MQAIDLIYYYWWIQKNLTDGSVRDWIIPNFTTTTDNDVMVSSVVMMAAMQSYFSYKFCLRCGIPNVTLLGTPEDWIKLRNRDFRAYLYTEKTLMTWLVFSIQTNYLGIQI